MRSLVLDQAVTSANFDEELYLGSNRDIARAVAAGHLKSGREHFDRFGAREGRRMRMTRGLEDLRQSKMTKLEPLLRTDLAFIRRGLKYDYLSSELRERAMLIDTTNVAANDYDGSIESLIRRKSDGLLLDVGAGRRRTYHENVVCFEVADYDSTDVLGIGEVLPFQDNAFDGIICVAVLEHVRDPFTCAQEIVRVLKPGGELICSVPFLQPLHGFPHHYYNMTPQGLRNLFEGLLVIDDHQVLRAEGPIWSLNWILRSWAEGLSGAARDSFTSLRVSDLLEHPTTYLDAPWVTGLSVEKNMELASATIIMAHKPGG